MKFDDAKPKSGKNQTRLEDLIDMLKLPDGKWVTIRLMPSDLLPVRRHWINIIGGKSGKEVKIPKFCISHDTSTDGDLEGVTCPYCEIGSTESFYLQNVISRDLQENEPAKAAKPTKAEVKSGFKQPGSESWTPVRVMRIPGSLAQKIQGLKELNKVKNKKLGKIVKYSVADPKFGCDISIKYDSKQSGTDKYQVQLGDRVALEENELEFLQYKLEDDLLTKAGREDEKTAKKEVSRMELAGSEDTESDDEDDDDIDLGKKSKKSKKGKPDKSDKKSKSKKPVDDDDDDEDDDDEDEDDEDERPSKKSKPKSKSKPDKSKKAKDKKSKKSKKSSDEDDEDDDDIPF